LEELYDGDGRRRAGELSVSKCPTTTHPSIGFTRLDSFWRKEIDFKNVSQMVMLHPCDEHPFAGKNEVIRHSSQQAFRDVWRFSARSVTIFTIFSSKKQSLSSLASFGRSTSECPAMADRWETRKRPVHHHPADQRGIRSVAVCLLHSYANPSHEKRIGEIIKEMSPGMMVSLSCEVVPHIEYGEPIRRPSMFVMPETRRYLEKLVKG
jgi:hypothetical protein